MIGLFVHTDRGTGILIACYGWRWQIRLLSGETIIRHRFTIIGRKPS